jgi:hypothetical protein
MADFSFFDASVAESREYRATAGDQIGLVRWFVNHGSDEVVILDEDDRGDGYADVRVRHQLDDGSPIGLARVNEVLGVDLPEDIDAFYRRFNGGVLFFREFFRLYSVDQIIERTLSLRENADGSDGPPRGVRVVRFCGFGCSGCEFVLRFNDAGAWEVFCTEPTRWEVDVCDPKADSGTVTDASFRAWLKRLCETDGVPIAPRGWAEDQYAARRLN